jgi:ribonuclease HI
MHGGESTHPRQVFQEASDQSSVLEMEVFGHVPVSPLTLWPVPPPSMIKVNWEAIVDKKHGRIGIGIIAHDCKWQVLLARSTTQNFVVEPIVAEALAALHTVIFCKEMCFAEIILKGDSLQIVKEINMELPQLNRFGHIVDDIRKVLYSSWSFRVVHIKRDANAVVHGLAKEVVAHVIDLI